MSDETGVPGSVPPAEEPVGSNPTPADEPVMSAPEPPTPAPAPAPATPPVAPPPPPVAPPFPLMPPAMPVTPLRPRTDALYFTMGFVAALIFLPIAAGALGSLMSLVPNLTGWFAGTAEIVLVLVVIGFFMVLVREGRKSDNLKLRSFGKGGLWAALAIPLVMLLAVGSCLVLVGQNL